jgi:hypothetical protein
LLTSHKSDVLDRLEDQADDVAAQMARATREEVGEFAAVRDSGFAAEVVAHARDHVHLFVRCARLERPPEGAELDFVRERGARRARELMSLDALLETYLIGQRTVWENVVKLAGDAPEGLRVSQELTALTFTYTHAINVALASAYVRERGAIESESERGRRDLIDRLLEGPGVDAATARRAEALGLRADVPHCVVVARTDDDERLGLVEQALAFDDRANSFVVVRNDEAIAIPPVYVRRGPVEVRAAVERATDRLARTRGVQVRAGVSAVCDGLGEVARGYAEARRALRHAPPGRAMALEEVGLVDYLTEHADEGARRLVPTALAALADDHTLAATLRAYADCDMNVARSAERLVVHPNTVHYRLRRVAEITDRDPRRFGDLLDLLLALRLRKSSMNP